MEYNFEWDSKKAKTNLIKHKVNFVEASFVFKDPKAVTIFDRSHSEKEDRWTTIGVSTKGNIIVVSHTFEKIDKEMITIRIISGRKGTARERKQYLEE